MRLNEDGKTVRAMDILFPGIGEIVGGSQREERLDVLKRKNGRTGYSRGRPLVVFRFKKIRDCCAFWVWTRI